MRSRQVPIRRSGWIAVVPLNETGCAENAARVCAFNSERAVIYRAGCENNSIVASAQVVELNIATELNIGHQANLRIVQRLFERANNVLNCRMIRSHAVAHQTKGNWKLFEQINLRGRVSAQTELIALSCQLTQQNIGHIHTCWASAHNSYFKISHSFE